MVEAQKPDNGRTWINASNHVDSEESEALAAAWEQAARIQSIVNRRYAGKDFESRDAKKEAIYDIQKLTKSYALKVLCPSCKRAARLRLQSGGTAATGAVQFQHAKTNHCGTAAIPNLEIVPIAALDSADCVIIPRSVHSQSENTLIFTE